MHPFDRYAAFTDLTALKAASEKPLRKSLRVNTLKTSVELFKKRAGERGWQLTPVPWCPLRASAGEAASMAAAKPARAKIDFLLIKASLYGVTTRK